MEKDTELLLGQPVHAFDFLLLTQLNTIVGNFTTAPLTVLPGGVTAAIEGALVRKASVALEKQLHIFTSA
jgi:hypothetical protein